MTDDSQAEPDDQQPEPASDETPHEHAQGEGGDTGTAGFRIAPGYTELDLSGILRVQAMTQEINARVTEMTRMNVDALRAIGRMRLRVPVLPQWTVRVPELPDFQRFQVDLAERMREAARISFTMPQFEFGADLGRILNSGVPTWLANVRMLIERLEQVIPENLRGLRSGHFEDVFRINVEDGTSLAWAPRRSIIDELLQAADMDARSTVLVAHAVEIADDVEASLAQVVLPEHQILRSLLLEAAGALRLGLYGPAQAAASNAFDTIMNVRMLNFLAYSGNQNRNLTRIHFRPGGGTDWEAVTFAELELVLVGGGIATAFERWTAGCGLASFNRNGSVHHVDDGAYCPAHAVRALLVAQATLRWLDTAIAEERGEQDAA
ncbi:hypothetical protein OG194_29650 [Streptomyces sp. NBC_01288]|uniref:hypothetical protein n=1 Tax=Streptomyces sp. NBC_01288 TaxID=2903814 RepID=UPI002E109469|nr:hypothetical protein OG194_29650 [Streptomyces sp. NBC_01288]